MEIEEEDGSESWEVLRSYEKNSEAYEHALVVLAMGEAVRVEQGDSGALQLMVETQAAGEIHREISEYDEESRLLSENTAQVAVGKMFSAGLPYLFCWICLLLVVFRRQLLDPGFAERYFSSSIRFIDFGEWWRPFTALFLHGDAQHIFGNIASGSVFGILVAKTVGPLRGWAMIFAAGTIGNAITSWLTYPQPFVSLGASTAVFGALGILSGTGIIENFRENVQHRWLRIFAPLVAGIILLGWLGGASVGSNTDVFGHVFGFTAGLLLGALFVRRDDEKKGDKNGLSESSQ